MPPIHLKTPLPEAKQTLLTVMDRVARLTGLRYFVIGATARDILMYHLHGLPLNRASPDIDFAMAIENWTAFEALRVALLQQPGFRSDAKILHRLHYSPMAGDDFPVDLVPFGGVETAPAQVAWPPDMAIVMNVVGYAEALDSAIMVSIADDCEIPVASIPGLVMTKLIAWTAGKPIRKMRRTSGICWKTTRPQAMWTGCTARNCRCLLRAGTNSNARARD